MRGWRQAGQPTPPTGWVAETIHPLQRPKYTEVAAPQMTGDGDAGGFYRDAIDDYRQNAEAYRQLATAKTLDPDAVADRPGLASLRDAGKCSRLFSRITRPSWTISVMISTAPGACWMT